MPEEKKSQQTKRLPPTWSTRLSDGIAALEWNTAGDHLAAATITGQVTIIPQNPAAGTPKTFTAHPIGLNTAAWHPGRDLLATGGQDGYVRLWNTAGEKIWEYQTAAAQVEKLAWSPSPENPTLAVLAGKSPILLSSSGKLIATGEALNTTPTDVCWYPHGPMFLTAAYGGLYVFHGTSGKRLRGYDWKAAMWNCRWSPDGKWVCGGSQENALHVWDANTGEHLHMPGYQGKIRALDWSNDSRLLATGNGIDVLVWNCAGAGPAGTTPQMFGAHTKAITDIKFQHRGDLFAAAGKDGHLMLWRAGGDPEPLAVYLGDAAIAAVRWSPDDKLLAAATAAGDVIIF